MANSGIDIKDPEEVRNVATQCQRIMGTLNEQANSLNTQLGRLRSSLQGQAAENFETQFAEWQKLVRHMSDTLNSTGRTLTGIADAAEAAIRALNQLGGH